MKGSVPKVMAFSNENKMTAEKYDREWMMLARKRMIENCLDPALAPRK